MASAKKLSKLLAVEDARIDYSKVREVLDGGADPLEGGSDCPLYKSLKLQSRSTVQLLLQYIEPERLLSHPNLLHYASANSSEDCVKLLLEACHSDFINSLSTPVGNTPLMVSLISRRASMALYLLANGSDPNISNSNGIYPVHLAAKNGSMDVLKILKGRTDFNVQDNNGDTPLHYSTDLEVIEYLIFEGKLDPMIENNKGLTAKSLASVRGNELAVIALEDMERQWSIHISKGRFKCFRYARETFYHMNIKLAIFVIIVCGLLAWYVTVFIHQRHPFQ